MQSLTLIIIRRCVCIGVSVKVVGNCCLQVGENKDKCKITALRTNVGYYIGSNIGVVWGGRHPVPINPNDDSVRMVAMKKE